MVKRPIDVAFGIALDIHKNQLDRGGDPYMDHVVRVSESMDTEKEKVAALLHDTIEDAPAAERMGLLIKIGCFFGPAVQVTVIALTHGHANKDEPYSHYIQRLSKDPLAVKVKFADLKDNLDPRRLAKLPTEDGERLWIKYRQALALLTDLTTKGESKPMTTRFRPLGERVLVRPIEAKPQEETKLILNDAHEEQVLRGEVIAIPRPPTISLLGSIIAYAPYSGKELSINGEKLLILTEEEILGIFEEV